LTDADPGPSWRVGVGEAAVTLGNAGLSLGVLSSRGVCDPERLIDGGRLPFPFGAGSDGGRALSTVGRAGCDEEVLALGVRGVCGGVGDMPEPHRTNCATGPKAFSEFNAARAARPFSSVFFGGGAAGTSIAEPSDLLCPIMAALRVAPLVRTQEAAAAQQ